MSVNIKKSLKKVVRFFVSNFGALILVILYLIGGGALFVFLELDNEIKSCNTSMIKYYQKLNETVERAIVISEGGYNRTVLITQVYGMLNNFSKDVYKLGVSPDANCETLGESDNLPGWNLVNSIYFCATIMTTIGYGHISPSTKWGQIICIIYSFIGIPIMLLYLGSLGEMLAKVFRLAYLNLCCCACFIKRHHLNESNNPDKLQFNDMINDEKGGAAPPKKVIEVVETGDEDEEETTVNIPIIVVTGFLALYMFAGAILFQIWEEWTIVEGIYFSFITVSTIGFGDYYPAKETIGSSTASLELIVGAVYSLVGLAVLSMCLTLIQDEITCKFQWLGEKFGINKKPPEEFDDGSLNDYDHDDSKPVILSQPIIPNASNNNAIAFNNESYENDFEKKQ